MVVPWGSQAKKNQNPSKKEQSCATVYVKPMIGDVNSHRGEWTSSFIFEKQQCFRSYNTTTKHPPSLFVCTHAGNMSVLFWASPMLCHLQKNLQGCVPCTEQHIFKYKNKCTRTFVDVAYSIFLPSHVLLFYLLCSVHPPTHHNSAKKRGGGRSIFIVRDSILIVFLRVETMQYFLNFMSPRSC